jgi:hypothetical protein
VVSDITPTDNFQYQSEFVDNIVEIKGKMSKLPIVGQKLTYSRSDLKVSTYIITSIQVHPFGLDAILVVMSVSTVITTVIAYIFANLNNNSIT